MSTTKRNALLSAAAAVVIVAAIAIAGWALRSPITIRPAAHQRQHAASAGPVPGAALGSQGAAITSSPAAQPAPSQAAPAPAPQAPATPAPASSAPVAPAPLTACTTIGDTATDAAGNLVQCTGGPGTGQWNCDPLYPYPGGYDPVPGQPAPPNGYAHVVLTTDGTAYVADVQVSGAWVWQLTAPPC